MFHGRVHPSISWNKEAVSTDARRPVEHEVKGGTYTCPLRGYQGIGAMAWSFCARPPPGVFSKLHLYTIHHVSIHH